VIKLSESKKVQRSVTQFDESKKSAYRIKIDIFAKYSFKKGKFYALLYKNYISFSLTLKKNKNKKFKLFEVIVEKNFSSAI